jgi:hypothetical protein
MFEVQPVKTALHEEIELGRKASSAGEVFQVYAGICVGLFALCFGASMSRVGGDSDWQLMFIAGFIAGVVVGLLPFFLARAWVLDLRRRQMYMDRS